MLELRDVHAYYGDTHVLRGVSFTVPRGAVVALLGRNGMGKTTTIRTIMGIVSPKAGSILLNGVEVSRKPPHRIARMGVGLVPQGRHIFRSLTVQENLTFAARRRGSGEGSEGSWNLDRLYEFFPILSQRSRVKGQLLSGGEQQMLAIARALMTNPDLLLLDEPSEGLAPIVVEEIASVIQRLAESEVSILLVEQNLSLALDIARQVYVLSKGVVVHEAESDAFRIDQDAKDRYLGAAAVLNV